MSDIANASLSGGVAVGAIADLMLQPYAALIAGTLTGAASTLGFRKLQAIKSFLGKKKYVLVIILLLFVTQEVGETLCYKVAECQEYSHNFHCM
jgi:hypothetical protein